MRRRRRGNDSEVEGVAGADVAFMLVFIFLFLYRTFSAEVFKKEDDIQELEIKVNDQLTQINQARVQIANEKARLVKANGRIKTYQWAVRKEKEQIRVLDNKTKALKKTLDQARIDLAQKGAVLGRVADALDKEKNFRAGDLAALDKARREAAGLQAFIDEQARTPSLSLIDHFYLEQLVGKGSFLVTLYRDGRLVINEAERSTDNNPAEQIMLLRRAFGKGRPVVLVIEDEKMIDPPVWVRERFERAGIWEGTKVRLSNRWREWARRN